MKHSNPNMTEPVLKGIAWAEEIVANQDPWGDAALAEQYEIAAQPVPRTGAFLAAKQIAVAQGYIAAYRSATEH